MNIIEILRHMGRGANRGRFPSDLVEVLGNGILDSFRGDDRRTLLLISSIQDEFAPLLRRVGAETTAQPTFWCKRAKKLSSCSTSCGMGLMLIAADHHRVILLVAQSSLLNAPDSPDLDVPLFDVFLTTSPPRVQRFLKAYLEKLPKAQQKTELIRNLTDSIPIKHRTSPWVFLGLDAAELTAQQLRKSVRTLSLTRFNLDLEQKLGYLYNPNEILQIFSNLLKERLRYDYLEVIVPAGSLQVENEPTNWIRNDTGYGGKLLSIILKESYNRTLSRRRLPIIISYENCDVYIENLELLKIMSLQTGALVPLLMDSNAYGVLKIFFSRRSHFDSELREWLSTCGAILLGSLYRAWRFQEAEKMATIDGLTGLYNHRYFMEQLQKEFTRARRYRNWLSLIIIDIDFFKHYNDANGHLAGDRVLARVAKTIRASVREMDLVARWGGEEFALLLPEISLENSMIVAEKIRREVEAQRFANERLQPGGKLTISLGVATNFTELKSYKEMFNKADAALYQAKQGGRNRCVPAK